MRFGCVLNLGNTVIKLRYWIRKAQSIKIFRFFGTRKCTKKLNENFVTLTCLVSSVTLLFHPQPCINPNPTTSRPSYSVLVSLNFNHRSNQGQTYCNGQKGASFRNERRNTIVPGCSVRQRKILDDTVERAEERKNVPGKLWGIC